MSDQLGPRLRAARMRSGLSLRAVAARADVSPSLISQIETGKVQPSVATLHAVVSCLGVSLNELFDEHDGTERGGEPGAGDPVLHVQDTEEIAMDHGVTWRALRTPVTDGGVVSLYVRYLPGGSSSGDGTFTQHSGTEAGVLVSGELILKLGFDTYVLRPGDSFSFDSARPHRYVNDSDQPAEGVWYEFSQSACWDIGAEMLGISAELPRQAAASR